MYLSVLLAIGVGREIPGWRACAPTSLPGGPVYEPYMDAPRFAEQSVGSKQKVKIAAHVLQSISRIVITR